MIQQLEPNLQKDSAVFLELKTFFGNLAQIEPDLADLKNFLTSKSLYRVIRVSGKSFRDCAYRLVDDFPEFSTARGMFRCYKTPEDFSWTEVEAAEKIISDTLIFDVYGWSPDAFTLIQSPAETEYSLSTILAFG